MKEWMKNVRQVVPYVPGEQPKETDIIKLNTNENPYPPSPKVQEMCSRIENLRLYPDPAASRLVDAIADYKGIGRDQVFVGVGSDDVLAMSFLTFLTVADQFFSRISPTLSTMCGRSCSGFRMRQKRWMRISVSVRKTTTEKTAA